MLVNTVNPSKMQHHVASDLGLHCLPITLLRVRSATYFRFSFRFFKKGSCQLLAKVCARSTG